MSKEAKIVKCEIRWKDCNFYKMPNVYVIYEGKEDFEFLFDYYPDEISFTEKEFIKYTIVIKNNIFHIAYKIYFTF